MTKEPTNYQNTKFLIKKKEVLMRDVLGIRLKMII